MSDDIIVFGKTKNEHDQNLNNVIQRLQESSLTLNKDKCLFGVSNLWSALKKVKAIREARVPTTIQLKYAVSWDLLSTARVLSRILQLLPNLSVYLLVKTLNGNGISSTKKRKYGYGPLRSLCSDSPPR
jgi:hypothetical protein